MADGSEFVIRIEEGQQSPLPPAPATSSPSMPRDPIGPAILGGKPPAATLDVFMEEEGRRRLEKEGRMEAAILRQSLDRQIAEEESRVSKEERDARLEVGVQRLLREKQIAEEERASKEERDARLEMGIQRVLKTKQIAEEEERAFREDHDARLEMGVQRLLGTKQIAEEEGRVSKEDRDARMEMGVQRLIREKQIAEEEGKVADEEAQARLDWAVQRIVQLKQISEEEQRIAGEEKQARLEVEVQRLVRQKQIAEEEKKVADEDRQARLEFDAQQLANRRIQEREARQPIAPIGTTPEERAILAAAEDMERERAAKLREEMRARMDPDYAGRLAVEKRKKYIQSLPRATKAPAGGGRGGMGTAGQLASAAGLPGVGGVLSSIGSIAGPAMAVGAAFLAVKVAINAAEQGIKAFGQSAASIAAGDAIGLSRAFTGLIGQIPLIGGMIQGIYNAGIDAMQGMEVQARRLSQYDAGLAMAVAQFDVNQILRDIQNARTRGPELIRGMEARNRFQENMDRIMTENLPRIMDFMESIIRDLPGLVQRMIDFFNWVQSATPATVIRDGIGGLGGSSGLVSRISRGIEQIITNTERAPDPLTLEDLLASMGQSQFGTLDAPTTTPLPAFEQGQFPAFAGL